MVGHRARTHCGVGYARVERKAGGYSRRMSDSRGGPGRVPGGEPVTARSALGLRAALSWGALVVGVVGAALLLMFEALSAQLSTVWTVATVACVAVVLVAAVDLMVIRRRRAQERAQRRG